MAEQKSPTGLKKVLRAPKALRSAAALSNAIVDYLGKIKGTGGITVQIAEAGMVIGFRTGAQPSPNIYADGSGSGSGSGGIPTNYTTKVIGLCEGGIVVNYTFLVHI